MVNKNKASAVTDSVIDEPDILAEELFLLRIITIVGDPSYSSRLRWSLRGCPGIDGNHHKLETVVIKRQRYTSHQAVKRFLEATNRRPEPAQKPITQHQRSRQMATADSALAEIL